MHFPDAIIATIASFAVHPPKFRLSIRQSVDDIRAASKEVERAIDTHLNTFPAPGRALHIDHLSTSEPYPEASLALKGLWYEGNTVNKENESPVAEYPEVFKSTPPGLVGEEIVFERQGATLAEYFALFKLERRGDEEGEENMPPKNLVKYCVRSCVNGVVVTGTSKWLGETHDLSKGFEVEATAVSLSPGGTGCGRMGLGLRRTQAYSNRISYISLKLKLV